MNNHTNPSPTGQEPVGNLDLVLQHYFKSEMPDPWPEIPGLFIKTIPAAKGETLWRKAYRYASIAAVVAVVVLGYWSLSGQFPTKSTTTATGSGMTPEATIGQRPVPHPPGNPQEPLNSSAKDKTSP